jgi:hypothetical protein
LVSFKTGCKNVQTTADGTITPSSHAPETRNKNVTKSAVYAAPQQLMLLPGDPLLQRVSTALGIAGFVLRV